MVAVLFQDKLVLGETRPEYNDKKSFNVVAVK